MDWRGNTNSIYKILGASNHTDKEREKDDFYATEPKAAELLCEVENLSHNIWECACGQGHLSKVFEAHGHNVMSSDLINRGYGLTGVDFLTVLNPRHNSPYNLPFEGDIITNPPYKYALPFIETALQIVGKGYKVAMFLKVQFLEGKERKRLFLSYPPKTIYVSSSRLLCAKNAEFEKMRAAGGSVVAYAWFVWVKGYEGDTVVKWIN